MGSGPGPADIDTPATYEIRVLGHLDRQWADWFDGLEITHAPNGESRLMCNLRDQAALHGLLNQLFTLNVTLLLVARRDGPPPETEPAQPAASR